MVLGKGSEERMLQQIIVLYCIVCLQYIVQGLAFVDIALNWARRLEEVDVCCIKWRLVKKLFQVDLN